MQQQTLATADTQPQAGRRAWLPWAVAALLLVSLALNYAWFSELRRVDDRAVNGVTSAAALTHGYLFGVYTALNGENPFYYLASTRLAKAQSWA